MAVVVQGEDAAEELHEVEVDSAIGADEEEAVVDLVVAAEEAAASQEEVVVFQSITGH